MVSTPTASLPPTRVSVRAAWAGNLAGGARLSWDADWDGDDYVLRARGRMKQVSFHGEHLQLTREITAKLGENRFAIHDVVENLAGRPEAHMILYHFNVGFPLLDEGSLLDVDVIRTDGLDERARRR